MPSMTKKKNGVEHTHITKKKTKQKQIIIFL